jgi:hypothetical protein
VSLQLFWLSINGVLKEEIMNKSICLTVALILFGAPAMAASKCDKEACKAVKADIREIQAKMRSGYTVAQGNRYEARLRKLRDKRSRICR